MNTMEKAVWAAVFAREFAKEAEEELSLNRAIERADAAVFHLRTHADFGGRLHDDEDLEAERRAELDIPEAEVEPGTWSGTDHVITDVAEVKPLLEEAFRTSPPPHVLRRFVRWLYGVTTFRFVDVRGHPNFSHATQWAVERIVDEFMGFDKNADDYLKPIKAWVEWRNSDHIVEIFGGMSEHEEAVAALVDEEPDADVR